jgi:nucleoside 2-deoxyribosyltransferase
MSKLLVLLSLLFALAAPAQAEKPTYYIYLAGPEVFLPEPVAAGVAKKDRIAQLNREHNWPFTLIGLYPLDNEIEDFAPDQDTGIRIFQANIDLMDQAHFIAANMVRFRGPSMDVGTAFEMGYVLGLKKPVFGYYEAAPFYGKSENPGIYKDRVAKYYPLDPKKPGYDIDGQSIENFQMADNLMMIGALESGAGAIASSFDQVVLQIAEYLLAQNP